MLNLRELRKKYNLTLKELGQELGLAESTLSQYENGNRQPSFEILLQLSKFFNVTVDYLLGNSNKATEPPSDNHTIGERLRQRRKDLGLTLADLAASINVSPSTIQRYENGAFEKIKLPVLHAIANELGVEVEWVLGQNPVQFAVHPSSKLANNLIMLRQKKGLTQADVAKALNLTRSTVGMYETGDREPNLNTLQQLAEFYGVDMNTLTGVGRSVSSIAERMQSALAQSGMSQAQLSAITGIGKSSISTYLSGEYEPKHKNISKIAKALDVDERWLLGEVPDPNTTSGIGDRIRLAREHIGLTQEELGTRCGTTKQTIYKYESGIVTNIPHDRLSNMAKILNVSPAYLMGWEKGRPLSLSSDRCEYPISDDDVKKVFFKDIEDLPKKEMDLFWQEAQDYIRFKIELYRHRKTSSLPRQKVSVRKHK